MEPEKTILNGVYSVERLVGLSNQGPIEIVIYKPYPASSTNKTIYGIVLPAPSKQGFEPREFDLKADSYDDFIAKIPSFVDEYFKVLQSEMNKAKLITPNAQPKLTLT